MTTECYYEIRRPLSGYYAGIGTPVPDIGPTQLVCVVPEQWMAEDICRRYGYVYEKRTVRVESEEDSLPGQKGGTHIS